MKSQVTNAKETVKGFFVQWVWEPMEGIGKTLRGGGEGLGVAPTTVQSDQAVSGPEQIDVPSSFHSWANRSLSNEWSLTSDGITITSKDLHLISWPPKCEAGIWKRF